MKNKITKPLRKAINTLLNIEIVNLKQPDPLCIYLKFSKYFENTTQWSIYHLKKIYLRSDKCDDKSYGFELKKYWKIEREFETWLKKIIRTTNTIRRDKISGIMFKRNITKEKIIKHLLKSRKIFLDEPGEPYLINHNRFDSVKGVKAITASIGMSDLKKIFLKENNDKTLYGYDSWFTCWKVEKKFYEWIKELKNKEGDKIIT